MAVALGIFNVLIASSATGDPIAGAKVVFDGYKMTANNYGISRRTDIPLNRTYTVTISANGYTSKTQTVAFLTSPTTINVSLDVAPTNVEWPWPFNAVQDWFEGLLNYISESVSSIIAPIVSSFNSVAISINNFISSSLNWLSTQISNGIKQISSTITEIASTITDIFNNWAISLRNYISTTTKWLNDNINNAIASVNNTIQNWTQWANDNIVNKITSIPALIQEWANDTVKSIESGISSMVQTIQDTNKAMIEANNRRAAEQAAQAATNRDNILTAISNGVSSLWDSMTGLAGDILGGAMRALGEALSGFVDWLLKSLTYIGTMIMGAVNTVTAAISSGVNTLINGVVNTITGAMSKGSPDPQTTIYANTLAQTIMSRQIEIIDSAYHSEPTAQGTQDAANVLLATGLITGVAALGVGLALDVVHPLKSLEFHATARELLYFAGVPAITASIITLPTAIGVLEPLRYFLNEKWQPRIPESADLTRFALREVWDEARRPLLLSFYPSEPYDTYMHRQGYRTEFAQDYWAAHWVLPSIGQLNEALYRGIIDYNRWFDEVRYNDLIPYAIPWLEAIIHPPWTRVDVRRMWEMRVITEEQMYREYKWLGYDDDHAKGMVLWTKVYVAFPDLLARYKNAWITAQDLYNEILALGVPEERANELMQTIIKNQQPNRVVAEKDLTKAEIIKGAKLWMSAVSGIQYWTDELNRRIAANESAERIAEAQSNIDLFTKSRDAAPINFEQAVELLMGLGYDENEARYILYINGIVSAGDPEGYWDMKRAVEAYKSAVGRGGRSVPQELVILEKQIKDKKSQIARLQAERAPDVIIGEAVSDLGALEYRYRQLLITYQQTS